MPDITLCINKECPLKKHCGRFMGKPDPTWQSFAKFQPEIRQTKPVFVATCMEFWDIREYPYKIKEEQQ